MNQLSLERRANIIHLLCEGNSLRATARIANVSFNTVVKLLIEVGGACAKYHDENVKSVQSKRIQCDEIWEFVYAKQKNVPANMKDKKGVGDVWTWTAIDADSKFIVSYLVGNRNVECAEIFINDVKSRLANRVQITTDGLRVYINAIDKAFGSQVDYAQLVKIYGDAPTGVTHRYSPAECTGAKKETINGSPDDKHVSTSYVERQNLTMRMSMRRFTRLTNAFSKKIENHEHAVALYFMYYNFVRIHKTLRVTPAMEAGVASHLWTIEDLVKLAEISN